MQESCKHTWDKTAQTWPRTWPKKNPHLFLPRPFWLWVTSTSFFVLFYTFPATFWSWFLNLPLHKTKLTMALSHCSSHSWADVPNSGSGGDAFLHPEHTEVSGLCCLWTWKEAAYQLVYSSRHTQIKIILVCVAQLMICVHFWTALLGLAFWDKSFTSCARYRGEYLKHFNTYNQQW